MSTATVRKSPPPRKRDRRQGTGAFWFLLGALVGGFGVGFAWMHHEQQPAPEKNAPTARAPASPPTFDFYQRLKQEEVLVPIEEPTAGANPLPAPKPAAPATTPQKPPSAATTPSSASSANRYQLQAGSFRGAADAEQRKAELALLGVSVNIQKANVGGQTAYRLLTGPVDQATAEALAKKLKAQGVNTLTRKIN